MRRREGWRPLGRIHVDPDREIEEELELHLEGRVREYMAEGTSETEAWALARERFGSLETAAAACRDARGSRLEGRPETRRVGTMIERVMGDVRLAVRGLRRRPGFTVAALLTLGLAVGASTAVFSVVNGVLIRPLPHPRPDELVLVWEVDQRDVEVEEHNPVTVATFLDWQRESHAFQAMAGFGVFPLTFQSQSGPESVMGAVVTADFFRVLAPDVALGRTFLQGEDAPGRAEQIAVISYEYWQSRFAGDPDVLGRRLSPTSEREVVGVLGPGFRFMDQRPQVIVPRQIGPDRAADRTSHTLQVVARLVEGVSPVEAQSEMDRIAAGLQERFPQQLTGWSVNVEPLAEHIVGQTRPALVVLLAAVGFVLLIGCVNVANLLLTRSLTERRTDALRAAVGASRARLIQQRLTEALVLALAGGALGIVLASVATRALVAAAPPGLPRVDEVALDGAVLGFALLVTMAVGIAFGLVPALQASRRDLVLDLREGARSVSGPGGQDRLRGVLAAAQVTVSLILLVSAGLMIRTFARLTGVDPGFEPNGVLTATVTMTGGADSTRVLQALRWDALLDRLAALPDVQDVGLTRFLPFDQGEWTWSVQIEGKPAPPEGEKLDYGMHAVSDGYFRTMRIPVVRGRGLEPTDRGDSPPVAVVNEAFVRRFFDPDEDPVGRRFALQALPDAYKEIVGVVRDTRHFTLDQGARPAFFLPYDQVMYDWLITEMSVAARTKGDPSTLAPALRRAIRSEGADLLVGDPVSMESRIRASVSRRRFALVLLSAFALAALSIAVVGIYGLMAYAVGQRRREIGVRIALGARPDALVARFLVVGLRTVLPGVVLGLLGAAAFSRLQASLLYGVDPVDPLTYAAVGSVLLATAAVATWLPARRAVRVDPLQVLNTE